MNERSSIRLFVLFLYVATAVCSGFLAFRYSFALPGLPWSKECGVQFLVVIPLSIAMLIVSVPALFAAGRLGLSGLLKWYSPVTGLLALSAGILVATAVRVPVVVAFALWMTISICGFIAVARLIGQWRRAGESKKDTRG